MLKKKIEELNNNYIYISDGTWFDKGSSCVLISNCGIAGGIFEGQRNGKLDQEFCPWDEFEILNKNENPKDKR